MSAIPTKQIDGDVAISRHASIGGRARVRGSARIDHNLIVEGWLDAPNIKGVAKGLFGSLDELQGSYPHPEAGWWALVGDTLPAALYVANGGKWEATGKSAGEPTVDCESYLRETEALQDAVDELGADVDALQTEIGGVKRSVTNLSTRVGNLETGLSDTQTSLNEFKGSVGKASGIAPLGTNRMVPSRYMLPELYNVVEFDGTDDTAASEISFAEGGFEAPAGEEYETHIVWLSAIGRFAATFRRKDGVSALSLDGEDASAQAAGAATEAGGSVGGAETGGGDIIAAGKYYKGWDHSERYCDEDGKPLAGKLYRSYSDGALYAATRDCQDLKKLYENMSGSGSAGDGECGCEALSIEEIDAMMQEDPDVEPTEAQRIDESEIDRLIDGT